jgi:hypothetical protein
MILNIIKIIAKQNKKNKNVIIQQHFSLAHLSAGHG